MTSVCILGGGPAGASAAIAARRHGADACLIERSRFPRHKVCGEFLSPEISPILDELGLFGTFERERPAQIRRMSIRVGRSSKTAVLMNPAFGLSRFAFDRFLWDAALDAGCLPISSDSVANIVTTGRGAKSTSRGGRLFGFKAHFTGPANDAVELFFSRRAYVGVNCVENGITNVCGLAPEEDLNRTGFDIDGYIRDDHALRERLAPLRRSWEWMFTGPLEFGQRLQATDLYYAGDALSFVDPFTGSGLLCALLTGSLAGSAAAHGVPVPEYLRRCSEAIRKPFWISSLLRKVASTRAAGPLLSATPAGLIFRLTRPSAMLVR